MINIGDAPLSDFTDPIGVLRDCHRRVERFLRVLVAVAERAQGGALGSEEKEALKGALRYFREAAPKHTADEEESLFPRLRSSRDARAAQAAAIAEDLEGDHERAAAHHAAVDARGGRWLADGGLPPGTARELVTHLEELRRIYERHIAVEDDELFPLAESLLSRAELAAVGSEMAARRRDV